MEPDLVPYFATLEIPARGVLVLAPHADDEAFGCGGAIRLHVANGVPVCVAILTDGALYGEASQREGESRAAAMVLGYGSPEFWGLPDRGLHCREELVTRVADRIKSLSADLVYAPSPWEIHPDHRQTAQLAIEAVALLGAPVRVIFYEVGAPLRPNVLLDITAVATIKNNAMACFRSQLEHQDYSRHIHALNQYRTYTLAKSVTAAEGFLLLSAAELAAVVPTGFFDRVSVGVPPSAESMGTSPGSTAQWPLVTVVVRSDDGDYLMGALDSIAVQTYPNIEVIVVARQAAHRMLPLRSGRFPLQLIPTDASISRSVAGNRGLGAVGGVYVTVLDAGDWLMPGHIARLVGLMSANPTVMAAHSGVRWVNAQGQPLDRVADNAVDDSGRVDGQSVPLCAVMMTKTLLDSRCRFDASFSHDDDASFLASICKCTVLTHLPGVSAIHRDAPNATPRIYRWISRLLGGSR